VLHAVIIVVLLGLGDSLNPATLGPAMYLATVEHPRRALTEFLIGFLAVNVVGGLVILLGPGELLLSLVPKPKPLTKHILEVVAGVVLIGIAIGLWAGRDTLSRRKPPTFEGGKRTGVKLGAGIAIVELPTAMPYFAAIAVIIGSGVALPGKIVMLLIYNVAFLAPVFAILFTLLVLGDDARQPLARVNLWVLGHWPGLLAALAAVIGLSVLTLGVVGLAR
jgi:cytochrome c biogenesis protein CcdA